MKLELADLAALYEAKAAVLAVVLPVPGAAGFLRELADEIDAREPRRAPRPQAGEPQPAPPPPAPSPARVRTAPLRDLPTVTPEVGRLTEQVLAFVAAHARAG